MEEKIGASFRVENLKNTLFQWCGIFKQLNNCECFLLNHKGINETILFHLRIESLVCDLKSGQIFSSLFMF
jgi:hypothetical protein